MLQCLAALIFHTLYIIALIRKRLWIFPAEETLYRNAFMYDQDISTRREEIGDGFVVPTPSFTGSVFYRRNMSQLNLTRPQ